MSYTVSHYYGSNAKKYEKKYGIKNSREQVEILSKLSYHWFKTYRELYPNKNYPPLSKIHLVLCLIIRKDSNNKIYELIPDGYLILDVFQKSKMYDEYKDRIEDILSWLDKIVHFDIDGCPCRNCEN